MSFLEDLPEIVADALGDEFFPAKLTRSVLGTPSGQSWKPSQPTTETYECRAIHDEWGVMYRDKGLVTAKDWKILVLAGTLATEPREGDKIELQGVLLNVISDGGQPAVTSDPANATWVLKCRM